MNSKTACVSVMDAWRMHDWLPGLKPGRQRRQRVSLRPHGTRTVDEGGHGMHGTQTEELNQ